MLPALAPAVPTCVEVVTIVADSDGAGMRNADALALQLENRGIDVRLVVPDAGLGGCQ